MLSPTLPSVETPTPLQSPLESPFSTCTLPTQPFCPRTSRHPWKRDSSRSIVQLVDSLSCLGQAHTSYPADLGVPQHRLILLGLPFTRTADRRCILCLSQRVFCSLGSRTGTTMASPLFWVYKAALCRLPETPSLPQTTRMTRTVAGSSFTDQTARHVRSWTRGLCVINQVGIWVTIYFSAEMTACTTICFPVNRNTVQDSCGMALT